ncbi:ATP-binding protein [Streptomyces sp. NPDC021100]|uniref:ATP-binding protein n=1 Tax=Streptomyces sp. NPDC021100 TaxID=3365114 RepID=UPI00378B461C
MKLVERGSQLKQLRSLLTACLHGDGGVALVTGPVACGKTSLVSAFGDDVPDLGALLLHASASQAEQYLPFGVAGQLFHTAPLTASQSQRSSELVDECVADSGRTEFGTIERKHVRVIHELCSLLLELAAHGPVVIVVDDIQYADRLSLQFLSYLARRLASEPVLIVLNERAVLEPTLDSFRAELLSHPHCRRIRLGPLSPAGIAELLADRVGPGPAESLSMACATLSGGNPLLVRALIDDHAAAARRPAGPPDRDPAVGDAYRDAVLLCLHRCGPDVVAGARGLAVLGDACTSVLLARLLGVEPHRADHIVDVLGTVGLLEDGRFRHPAARAAVLDNIAAHDRTRLHLRAAELLYRDGAPAPAVAAHLVTSGPAKAPWAVPVLREAAGQALSEDDTERAVELLKLAHRACSDDRLRATLATELASVEWRLNPSATARLLPELTTALHDGLLRDADPTAPIVSLVWHGHFDEAADALKQLHETVDADSPRAVHELHALRLWASASCPGLLQHTPAPAWPPPDREPPFEAPSMDMRLRAATAFTSVLRNDRNAEALAAAEHVLQGCHLGHAALEPVRLALLALIYADRLDKATPWCDALLLEASARRSPAWQATLHAIRGDIALRLGDATAAEGHARTALSAMSERSWGVAAGAPLGTLLQALTALGRYAEAEVLTRVPPPAVLETRWGLAYLYARGRYYLATDRLRAALSDFATCGELMTAWDMDLPGFIPWRADAARALLRHGDEEEARRLAEEQFARPGARRGRTHGIGLRTLAACGELRRRPHLLRRAAEEFQEHGDRLELAEALTELSEAHHVLGESDRARMMARRAWYTATECRAEPLLRRLSASLTEEVPEVSPDTAGATALSDAERRVATLAAKGHTNREIARKLYITVSTVEQHLTRAYRKLDVRSRADLPVWLQPSGAAPA